MRRYLYRYCLFIFFILCSCDTSVKVTQISGPNIRGESNTGETGGTTTTGGTSSTTGGDTGGTTGGTTTITSSEAYEVEPNNSFAEAQLINADTSYIGDVGHTVGYVDYFKIVATGNIMTVSLPRRDAILYDVSIYNSSHEIAGYFVASDKVNSKAIGVTLGQIYYISVRDSGSTSSRYKLKVNFQ